MSVKGTPRSAGYGKHWSHETVPINADEWSQYGSEAPSTPLDDGHYRPDQVFDLSLDYEDDEELLLDWRPRTRLVCCGWGLPCILPEWWYRLLPRQRKVVLGCIGTLVAAVVLVVAAAVLLGVQISGLGFHRSSAASMASSDGVCSWSAYRLPSNVLPTMYNLTFDVELEQPSEVQAVADIGLDVQTASSCIVLHAALLNITSVQFGTQPGSWRPSSTQQDQLVLYFPEPLPAGHGLLSLHFQYTLRSSLSGFYLATSTSPDGETRRLAITDFEATAARKAFPCFDEPQLKAPFQLQLTAPSGLAALSNTPEVETHNVGGGRTRHVFAPTPPMSTYLFAMVVGNMTYVHWEVADTVVRVWGVPGRSRAQLDAAAKVASRLLPFYEQLFDMPYPLQKLDLVAVPDYAGGAMENWGLITFRESFLLADPQTAGLQEQLGVASIIAHEVAHMWFGDTVTFAFWGDLWLAEGPATYFEAVGGEAAAPGSAFLDRFFADSVTRFLDHDAVAGATHPLATDTSAVTSDSMIESFFDPVVYEKGAALLRMLRAFLNRNAAPPLRLQRRRLAATAPGTAGGNTDSVNPAGAAAEAAAILDQRPAQFLATSAGGSRALQHSSRTAVHHAACRTLQGVAAGSGNSSGSDPFIAGLRRYLAAHKFGSATTADLWSALADASGSDVSGWMDAWTHQAGFPLVTLRIAEGDGDGSAPLCLTAEQEPFASEQQMQCDSSGSNDGSRRKPWWLPLAYVTGSSGGGGGASAAMWVVLDSCATGGPLLELADAEAGWAKLNAGQLAPVRVQYPDRLWHSLAAAAEHADQLPQVDVAGLIDDAWAIAKAGRGRVTPFLDLVRSLARRVGAEYSPWTVAARHLGAVQALLQDSPQHSGCADAWAAFVQHKVLPGALSVVTKSGSSGGSFVVGASDPAELRLIRPTILKLSGDFGNQTLQADAAQLLAAAGSGSATSPPDLAAVVGQLAVQGGDAAAVDSAVKSFQTDASPAARDRALAALTAATQADQAQRVLALVLQPGTRPQDVVPLVRGFFGSTGGAGPAAAWRFLQQHVRELYTKLDGGTRAAGSVAQLAVAAAQQPAAGVTAAQLQDLFTQHDSVLPRKPYLDKALAAVHSNGAWLDRHTAELCEWLDGQ